MKSVVIAGGCFWGMEDLFGRQKGVVDTDVGYTGGSNDNPTYEFHPGHAEALRLTYDPDKITLDEIYDYFFRIHDPTTLNRQGNDRGTSYRSTIFYLDDEQKESAKRAVERNQKHWEAEIVTTIEPLKTFWIAEGYHQDYLRKNPGGYTCHFERDW